MKLTTANKDNYASPDGLVRIEKTTEPRRWPPHGYPVVVVALQPRPGTRVLARDDGTTEWMPRFSEILVLILKLGLKVSNVPSDKPEERRRYWQERNARRHKRNAP